jgi:hypothetical protein
VAGVFRVAVALLGGWPREDLGVTLGRADRQVDLFDDAAGFCEESLPENSIYRFLARERDRLFPDELFADLFTDRGRRSVPPSVVATVMVLQRLEGLSDREAVDRYAFDVRWRYAAGVGGYGTGRWGRFAHTVLVDMRERLRGSQRPDRIFEVGLQAAHAAGVVGRRRVLDSVPLYDAVATMDTVTLIRSALRGLLAAADAELAAALRTALTSGDDYASAAKPQIDWDDPAAREELIDSRARDGFGVLAVLEGRKLDGAVGQAAALLATVLGQDLDTGADGMLRIARRVAKDRVISTVDPDTRHGHKTSARGFDGYKGHIAVDPDSEIITGTAVTAGNSGDAEVAEDLLADLLPGDTHDTDAHDTDAHDATDGEDHATADTTAETTEAEPVDGQGRCTTSAEDTAEDTATAGEDQPAVYGDAAYGAGELLARLEAAGIHAGVKVQPPAAVNGHFAKDRFVIDLEAQTVTCPAGVTTPIRPRRTERHVGQASFGTACASCPLAAGCTTAKGGRTITIGPHETRLATARAHQTDPAWRADYTATRPKVERKIGHLMRRRHGGRRARMRGRAKIAADFNLLAAAVNLARLAALGLTSTAHAGWTASAG